MMDHSGLYLSKQFDKNWGLYLVDKDMKTYLNLKAMVYDDLKNLNPFIQSDSDPMTPTWDQHIKLEDGKTFDSRFLFIEFWTDNQEAILEKSLEVANKLGLDLILE